jgi:hypothetical protein
MMTPVDAAVRSYLWSDVDPPESTALSSARELIPSFGNSRYKWSQVTGAQRQFEVGSAALDGRAELLLGLADAVLDAVLVQDQAFAGRDVAAG